MKKLMKQLHSAEEIHEVIQNESITILTYSAEWCPDCLFIKPFMPKLIDEFTNITFYYVDRDECIDTAKDMMVMGIPSFVAFKDGEEIGRFVSKMRKSEQEIRNFLNELDRKG